MKKPFMKIAFVAFAFLISFQITHAFSFPALNFSFFPQLVGGVISSTGNAPEIQTKEDDGYDCNLEGGSTIQVSSVDESEKAPVSYYISGNTTPVTDTTPTEGQGIIGISDGEKVITCMYDQEGKRGGFLGLGAKKVQYPDTYIKFPEISYFGTSEASEDAI